LRLTSFLRAKHAGPRVLLTGLDCNNDERLNACFGPDEHILPETAFDCPLADAARLLSLDDDVPWEERYCFVIDDPAAPAPSLTFYREFVDDTVVVELRDGALSFDRMPAC